MKKLLLIHTSLQGAESLSSSLASDYVAQIESEVGPLERALAPPDVAVGA